jgi:anti-sigma factor RsiW
MTAAVDDELAAWRRRRLARHLAGCAACRAEMEATEHVLGAVARLGGETEVPLRLEHATLRRARLEAAGAARPGWWLRVPVPVAALGAVALLAVGLLRDAGDAPQAPPAAAEAVSRPRVRSPQTEPAAGVAPRAVVRAGRPPRRPPADLTAAPGLFIDLPILRHLEKLENFDAIRTTTLDADRGAPVRRSNG